MHIDLRTVSIKPLRHTFDNIARRLGADKPATRYQEGTLDMQQTVNFHYRPTWDPDHEIYDASRTAIKMADWYAFKDPRQFYYGAYTMARAKQQDTATSDIDLLLVSDVLTLEDVYRLLADAEQKLGRIINPTLYTRQEFQQRLQAGNPFLTRVLASETLVLIGTLSEVIDSDE